MNLKAWSIFIALCLSASGQTVEVYNQFGKQDDSSWKNPAKQIFICDQYHGRWLTIGRVNTVTNDGGFDASMTFVISKFKPIVKKINGEMYEITFTQEIAKDLP